jgi:hypothetical protein
VSGRRPHRGCSQCLDLVYAVVAPLSTWEPMGWFDTYETSTLRLEASTICQLACPSCATTHGTIKAQIGAGFLKFDDFRRLVDENPWVWEIELSNWGEIFLNPDIERIIAYAYRRSVALMACNGANLNHVKPGVLEAMVRYKFRAITCSIDGVSQGTYEAYRRRGQLDRVLGNIRRLNDYKKRWKSEYPMLCWQMIAFGHNEHEIAAAQALARELGMAFCLKINYDDNFSPVKERDAVRQTVARTRLGAEELPGERDEYLTDDLCSQLWRQPQINFDGTLLGCCVNMWSSFGENVFAVGVKRALDSEKLRYDLPEPRHHPALAPSSFRRARPQGISQETWHGARDGVGRQPAGKMVADGADAVPERVFDLGLDARGEPRRDLIRPCRRAKGCRPATTASPPGAAAWRNGPPRRCRSRRRAGGGANEQR